MNAAQTKAHLLLDKVKSTSAYQGISDEMVLNLLTQLLPRYKSDKEVIKAVKGKLHQVAGVFQKKSIPYQDWCSELDQKELEAKEDIQAYCQDKMTWHVSSNERLPHLSEFYDRIFDEIGSVTSILDIACGLNPLAVPWMHTAEGCIYYACDIYPDMLNYLDSFFNKIGFSAQTACVDLASNLDWISRQVEVAFLFKTLSSVEHLKKNISSEILQTLNAKYIVVTYPGRSIGGRNKGMEQFYEQQFEKLLESLQNEFKQLTIANELVYILSKNL